MTENAELAAFLHALDRYGAHMQAWPPAERRAGEEMLARSAEARAQRDLAERAGLLVRASLDVAPPPHLASRILAHAAARRAEPAWYGWLVELMPRNLVGIGAGAAVVLLACGVLLGAADQTDPYDDDGATAIVALLSPTDLAVDGEN